MKLIYKFIIILLYIITNNVLFLKYIKANVFTISDIKADEIIRRGVTFYIETEATINFTPGPNRYNNYTIDNDLIFNNINEFQNFINNNKNNTTFGDSCMAYYFTLFWNPQGTTEYEYLTLFVARMGYELNGNGNENILLSYCHIETNYKNENQLTDPMSINLDINKVWGRCYSGQRNFTNLQEAIQNMEQKGIPTDINGSTQTIDFNTIISFDNRNDFINCEPPEKKCPQEYNIKIQGRRQHHQRRTYNVNVTCTE